LQARHQSKRGPGILYSARFRGLAAQMLVLALTLLLFGFFARNAVLNTSLRSIGLGFDFLWREAGFGIGQSIIPFAPTDTYLKAFVVGIINSIRVSLVGIVLATLLGFLIGAGAQSTNGSIRRLSVLYVEIFRNIPLLLQLYFWYSIVLNLFPAERAALSIFGKIFVSKAGVAMPGIVFGVSDILIVTCLILLATVIWLRGRKLAVTRGTALPRSTFWACTLIVFSGCLWIYLLPVEHPEFKKFGFVGGIDVSAEFMAVAFGLSTYTASFIAEIVRAGILAVPSGQLEAAKSLGLTPSQTLFLVRIPQALRLIIPPLTSQYLNLTKNSSLAVAIGYADLVSVANTSLTQTARAIECITIVMAVYLMLSLLTSLGMNLYNRRLMLKVGRR